jgi:peptidoglycan/xylan/chitin deacetylase (PgdA/CDA1 family)
MASPKSIARRLAYAGGVLGANHRLLHRDTLTVVMFHRVTVVGSPAEKNADPEYSVAAPLFAACLRFFRRHYSVIGLEQLRASLLGGIALPRHSLLITFDDGWQDNVSVALPILRRQGFSAAVFVAADVLAQTTSWWWQEILLRALRTGRASWDQLWALAGGKPPSPGEPELALLACYGALDPWRRLRLLAPFVGDADAEGAHMIGPGGLRELAAGGVGLGAHGAAHLPLTMLAEPDADLGRARAVLEPQLRPLGQPLDALSFPHGRYDAASLVAARAHGFSILLTSDPCLNAAPAGRPGGLLGRIPIDAAAITDEAGALAPSRLATWLFHRPVEALAG